MLLGITGSGKTFTLANVIARLGRPALVISPNKTLAAQLYGEFKSFFPADAVEYFVSYYDYYQPEAYIPQSDTYIEKDALVNDEIDRMRHSATTLALRAARRRGGRLGLVHLRHRRARDLPGHAPVGCEAGPDHRARRRSSASLVAVQYERNDVRLPARDASACAGDVVEIFPGRRGVGGLRVELFGRHGRAAIHASIRCAG